MKYIYNILLFSAACLIFYSCKEDEIISDNPTNIIQYNAISISGKIKHRSASRVNDGGFVDQDAIGVYIVDYRGDNPGELLAQGNHTTNMKFTYHESTGLWEGTSKIYWTDKKTAVDAMSYYPFRQEVSNPKAMPIEVLSRQDKDDNETGFSNYEASDFLWAKAENVQPGSAINLAFNHMMAGLEVCLVPGAGFETSEWAQLEKNVIIKNMLSEAAIDLSTGAISNVSETRINVVPYDKGNATYRAVVQPQTVSTETALLDITLDGRSYQFKCNEELTLTGNKLHKFTIQVVKSLPIGDYEFSLIDEAIMAWEDDGISHGGAAREYIVVNSPIKGELEAKLKATGLDLNQITNLKIVGEMTDSDFEYIRNNITNLEAINLKEVKLKDCGYSDQRWGGEWGKENDVIPNGAFYSCKNLRYIVFPTMTKKIGANAFYDSALIGALDLPEGLTRIGDCAFENRGNLYLTSLKLPSTLEHIGYGVFAWNKFNNELILPQSLKTIHGDAFQHCYYMWGELHLPDGLTELGAGCFGEMSNITGKIVIPVGIKQLNRLGSGLNCSSIALPEGLEIINDEALWNIPIRGELYIPNSVRKIGRSAFSNTDISYIHLPEGLTEIPAAMLQNCDNLLDTLYIPEGVSQIRDNAFEGCSRLTAIILPSTLEAIGGNGYYEWISKVFAGCNSLNLLRCDAKVPPVLIGNVFEGVAKDNFTIEVPEESVELYRNAEGWKEFKRISAYHGFVCRPQFANLLNKGHERQVVLNATGSWTVIHKPSWCNISAMSGSKKTALTIKIDNLADGIGTRQDSIVFNLSDKNINTCFYIKQYDSEYKEDDVQTLQTATEGVGIDLVIIGDGYDAADIAEGAYINAMKQTSEYFFGAEPYLTYRDYFNVYTAFAMSDDSGIGTLNTLRSPKFETTIDTDRLLCNEATAFQYVADNFDMVDKSLNNTLVILMSNSDIYEGRCYMYGNGAALAHCTMSTYDYPYDARGIVQHEAGGHGFGKFADEYTYHRAWIQTCPCICCEHLDGLRNMQTMGWGKNLSITGKYKEIPWYHLVHDSRYNDIVDIYEGGYYHSNGVYRSESNSVMNNNVPYFSTWCRELIVRRIKSLAGETFDYEDFVSNDSREWGRDFTVESRGPARRVEPATTSHGTHPVIIKGSPKLKNRKK